jgi:DNA-binding Xre family transcriptional regulator
MNIRHYEEVVEKFKTNAPHLAALMEDWRPRGDFGIRVILKDKTQYDYDIHYPAPRIVRDIKLEDAIRIDDTECRKIFAYRVKDAMIRKGHNQASLAEYTGISKATISNYLAGKCSATLPHIRKIAYALGCSVGELID